MFWTQKSICKGTEACARPHRQIPEKGAKATASSGSSMKVSDVASGCEYLGGDCSYLDIEVPG